LWSPFSVLKVGDLIQLHSANDDAVTWLVPERGDLVSWPRVVWQWPSRVGVIYRVAQKS